MAKQEWITFKAIEVRQPIGVFYIGAIDAKDLVAISYADIRRMEDRDIEKIVGIQRPLAPKRVKEISQYVETVDATFPTSIILAVDSENKEGGLNIKFDSEKNALCIRRSEKVAQIIDGQHRIAGLETFKGEFQLNVAIFVDMDLEDKGTVFATINLQQTRVSKSLAYDLFEYARARSPQKTSHNIAKLFCREEGSPFEGRIKILGTATGGTHEFLTQAAFVDPLIPLISRDPVSDRDRLKRGKKLDKASGMDVRRLIFRNLFVEGDDAKIARILWNYFKAIAEHWPKAWNSTDQGNILPRTNGFRALMRFLVPAYNSFSRPDGVIKKEEFASVFAKSNLKDADFTRDNYVPGTSGQTTLYNDLKVILEDRPDLFSQLS